MDLDTLVLELDILVGFDLLDRLVVGEKQVEMDISVEDILV